jgi:hypothetical protein
MAGETVGVRVVKRSLKVNTRSIDSAEMLVGAVVHVADVVVVVVVVPDDPCASSGTDEPAAKPSARAKNAMLFLNFFMLVSP